MLVSRVRETTDHSDERALAVDVVFHPWVMRSCKGEPMFRDQVRKSKTNREPGVATYHAWRYLHGISGWSGLH